MSRPSLRNLVCLVAVSLVFALLLSVLSPMARPAAAQGEPTITQSCGDVVGGPRVLSVYTVKDGELTHQRGTDCVAGRRIFARFAKLIPQHRRSHVSRFELLSARVQGAEVFQNRNLVSWTLAVGLRLQPHLDYILIHEFAHLLTLHRSQVPPVTARNADRVERNCQTYFSGEGCTRPWSVLNRFVDQFWPQPHVEIVKNSERHGLARRFPNRYVNPYAATNPGEDIAESFATFVTTPRPTGSQVADRKLNFFWDLAPMVTLRTNIRCRANLDSC